MREREGRKDIITAHHEPPIENERTVKQNVTDLIFDLAVYEDCSVCALHEFGINLNVITDIAILKPFWVLNFAEVKVTQMSIG